MRHIAIAAPTALLSTALLSTALVVAALPGPAGAASFSPALVPSVERTVASNLDAPWGLAFLPNGKAVVAERDSGRIKLLNGKGGRKNLGRVPGVLAAGEGGLLGLAVPKDFAASRWIYAYFTGALDNRIVRMKLSGGRLGSPQKVLTGIPKGVIHNGGRLAFGPDGMLYAGTGEAGQTKLSQDAASLGGKILRMTPSGSVPGDNPTGGSLVYSRGHRNVQGLAFDGKGRLFSAEFGQNTWDELNLIRPGRNYGWPVVEGVAKDGRFVDPVVQWRTEVASPSGIAIVKGTVFMAGLRGQRLWRVRIGGMVNGNPAAKKKAFLSGRYGRLRTVTAAPDGTLWLTTSNTDGRGDPAGSDDRVLRIRLRAS